MLQVSRMEGVTENCRADLNRGENGDSGAETFIRNGGT